MQLWRGVLRTKTCVCQRIKARYIYLATTIISLYKRFLRIIGYLASLLLLIIVSHNPDFNNQFEQFQNVICPFQKSNIVITTMKDDGDDDDDVVDQYQHQNVVDVSIGLWLLRVASPRSILLAFASCTGSCRNHQSKALSCSCSDGNPLLLQHYNPRCSSPSFASQNTCQAPWTARGFELLCS